MYKIGSRIALLWFKATRRFYWIGGLLVLLGLTLTQTGVALAFSFTEFAVPTSGAYPFNITTGSDGNLWFTERTANKIGRITPTGTFTEFPIPTANSDPYGITSGPDANLWFTEYATNKIGRITPTGVFTEFPTPTVNSNPFAITAGPDGNLWFTEYTANKIGRITPAGTFTEFSIPSAVGFPTGITSGPDGNIWFTEEYGNKIGRITPAGTFTEFSININSLPIYITVGSDGNLWFTEYEGNRIGRITPAGTITEFNIPTGFSNPIGITSGSDGNIWFIEANGSKVARVTPTGNFVEFNTPTASNFPYGITSGPDGNIWFTELNDKIGRLTLDVSPVLNMAFTPATISVNAASSLTFSVTNPNTTPLTALSFSDILPANLVINQAGITANNCVNSSVGGVTSGSTSFTFTMPSLPASSNCSFTLQVTSAIAGSYTNKVTAISSAETGSVSITTSATLTVGTTKSQVNPADLVGQLRVTPDRIASLEPSSEISFTFSVKNVGLGRADNISLRFPIDPNLEVGYANFSDTRSWVSAIVTNVAQPYIKIDLPNLEPKGELLRGTIIFRPRSTANAGSMIFTRYKMQWNDESGTDRSQSSNAVRFVLGDTNLNVSNGAVQLFDPSNTSAVNGSTLELKGDFYLPNELVTLWYTNKDGISTLLGTKQADGDGKLEIDINTQDFKIGEVYVIAGFGNRSEITGSSVLTIST